MYKNKLLFDNTYKIFNESTHISFSILNFPIEIELFLFNLFFDVIS